MNTVNFHKKQEIFYPFYTLLRALTYKDKVVKERVYPYLVIHSPPFTALEIKRNTMAAGAASVRNSLNDLWDFAI